MSCFARRIPFSSGSGVFVREIIPWTALISPGLGSARRPSAIRRTSPRGTFCRAGPFRRAVGRQRALGGLDAQGREEGLGVPLKDEVGLADGVWRPEPHERFANFRM